MTQTPQSVGNAGPSSAQTVSAASVVAGARVRLWKRDGVATIDLAGVALTGGGIGSGIRVRVTPGGKILRGTVRAAGSVELDVPGSSAFAEENQ